MIIKVVLIFITMLRVTRSTEITVREVASVSQPYDSDRVPDVNHGSVN